LCGFWPRRNVLTGGPRNLHLRCVSASFCRGLVNLLADVLTKRGSGTNGLI
jgi:hypothetical protein